MKEISVFLIYFTISLCLNAQDNRTILSVGQNEIWLDSVSVASLDTQIMMIKERIVTDYRFYSSKKEIISDETHENIAIPKSDSTKSFLQESFPRREKELIYAIREEGKKRFDLQTISFDSKIEYESILAYLTPNKVSKIDIIRINDTESALFGAACNFGVIIIEIKKEKEVKN